MGYAIIVLSITLISFLNSFTDFYEKEEERGKERNNYVRAEYPLAASCMPPEEDQARNLSEHRMMRNQLNHAGQGLRTIF